MMTYVLCVVFTLRRGIICILISCAYVQEMSTVIASKLGIKFKPTPWVQWLAWFLLVSRGKTLKMKMLRSTHAALIYYIWQECCLRTHQH